MSVSSNVLLCLRDDLSSEKMASFPGLTDEQLSVATYEAKRALYAKVFAKLTPGVEARKSCDEAAISVFTEVNERMRNFRVRETYVWETWEDELYGSLRKAVYDFFYPSGDPLVEGFSQILNNGSLGSGSNLSADGTDFYTKLFSSNLGVTSSSLYSAYNAWSKNSPLWSDAEKSRQASGYGVDVHETSRITCVPKSDTISRTICVEPSLNMFYQLGLGNILRGRLKQAFGIDLTSQPDTNRVLAHRGSVRGDLATIDLSSASDSISLSLFRDLVPKDQACWFEILRARAASLPDGSVLELGMLSTMGNGFTFPFETMLFSCIVKAAYLFAGLDFPRAGLDGTRPSKGETGVLGNQSPAAPWSVFGDDIICDVRAARYVLRLLHLTGFVANRSKTFVEGPFRESCGCDYIYGHNIRPVYIKNLATQEERYTVINRLVEWSASTGIMLRETLRYLLRTVKWRPIPWGYGYDAGIFVPLNLATGLKANRNGSLQIHLRVPMVRKLRVEGSRVVVPAGEKQRCFNDAGIILSVLQGSVRGLAYPSETCEIGIRSSDATYRSRVAPAPSWHGINTFPGGLPGWLRWVDAAAYLLQ